MSLPSVGFGAGTLVTWGFGGAYGIGQPCGTVSARVRGIGAVVSGAQASSVPGASVGSAGAGTAENNTSGTTEVET